MDGISRAKMQEAIGVRETVQDIDALRMMLGSECVTVLTPKVEIRLRSAARAQIPLKLSCKIDIHERKFHAVITFPSDYPVDSLLIEITDKEGSVILNASTVLQKYCATSRAEHIHDHFSSGHANASEEHSTIHPRATDAINYLRRFLEEYSLTLSRIEINNDNDAIDVNDVSMIIEGDGTENVLENNIPNELNSAEHSSEIMNIEEDKYYCCMVCGFHLFNDSEVEKHSPTQKDIDRRGGKMQSCSSIFVTSPPKFLDENKILENTVKMACPKCSGKLGLICWTGSQCSCGAWITPAIQFISSKIDLKRKNFDILSFTNLKSSQPIIRTIKNDSVVIN